MHLRSKKMRVSDPSQFRVSMRVVVPTRVISERLIWDPRLLGSDQRIIELIPSIVNTGASGFVGSSAARI